ncbi:MAG: nuclear transport factor 2 family protein [Myxococcota bacterium]|nr:nuclear transport factor 2 family protein [Myxococcota bacterium]
MKTNQTLRGAQRSFVAVVVLAACSSSKLGPPAPPPVDWRAFEAPPTVDAGQAGPTANERAAAESYVGALASANFLQLASLLGGDVHLLSPGVTEARGLAPVVAAHVALFGAFGPHSVSATRIWRTATAHMVEWTMSGTQTREWLGVKPAGGAVAVSGLTLFWTQDDGTISEVHVYFDVPAAKAQLGAGPKQLGPAPTARTLPAATPPRIFGETGSSEEQANVSLAREALDALEGANEPAYLSAMADDVTLITPERPRPLHGKEELRGYFRALHKSIVQLDTTVESAWGISNFVVIEYSISGEQVGPVGWVPPQRDAVLRLHVVDVIEARGGRLESILRRENLGELVSKL